MKITYFYKNLSKQEEARFFDYLGTKEEMIKGLLKNFSTDACVVRASIQKFVKHDAYEVELHLTIPTKSFVAKEASHSIEKAVDDSKDRLVVQIKKHNELFRSERNHSSIRAKVELVENIATI